MALKLTVLQGPEAGRSVPLTRTQLVIGRGAEADLRLASPGKRVSRRHARLMLDPQTGRWLVQDLQSQNGTLVEGRPVEGAPVPLPPGSVLRVGEYALVLEPDTPAALSGGAPSAFGGDASSVAIPPPAVPATNHGSAAGADTARFAVNGSAESSASGAAAADRPAQRPVPNIGDATSTVPAIPAVPSLGQPAPMAVAFGGGASSSSAMRAFGAESDSSSNVPSLGGLAVGGSSLGPPLESNANALPDASRGTAGSAGGTAADRGGEPESVAGLPAFSPSARPAAPSSARDLWQRGVAALHRAAAEGRFDLAARDVLSALLEATGATAAGVMFLDSRGRLLEMGSVSSAGLPGGAPTASPAAPFAAEPAVALRAMQRRTILRADRRVPPAEGASLAPSAAGVERTWVPVLLGERMLGAIQIDRALTPEASATGNGSGEPGGPAESGASRRLAISHPDALAAAADTLAVLLEHRRSLSALRQDVRRLRTETLCEPMLGNSPALRRLMDEALRIARTDAGVLITGESGAGKRLLASRLHFLGRRADGPLVRQDCSRRSAAMLDCELFGYVDGAGTASPGPGDSAGPVPAAIRALGPRETLGRFREAEGGTLVLVRVDDLPTQTQERLLRALRTGRAEPIGGGRPYPVNVRLIATAGDELEKAVEAGRLLPELYRALNVLRLAVPPLRERADDIAPLATHFLGLACATLDRTPPRISEPLARLLAEYRWPGNVRQLRTAMSRLAMLSPAAELTTDDWSPTVPDRIRSGGSQGAAGAPGSSAGGGSGGNGGGSGGGKDSPPSSEFNLTQSEKRHIAAALEHTKGSVAEAAKLLGIARGTLYRKMDDYGIRPVRE
jgi:DNA-binding NtrC family response regulator/pSer/pThr/pTyr-binding forkhead associated (FHA) protein